MGGHDGAKYAWWLFGAGYLGYTGARSFDKWRGLDR